MVHISVAALIDVGVGAFSSSGFEVNSGLRVCHVDISTSVELTFLGPGGRFRIDCSSKRMISETQSRYESHPQTKLAQVIDAELAGHVGTLIREAAEGELLPRFGNLSPDSVQHKRSGELVTVADVATERRLTEGLAGLLPGVEVVGEEAVEHDQRLLDLLDKELCWVVDPLDGTANFAAGKAGFAIIVCLICKARAVAGWIYDVKAGVMAVGIAGQGVTINGKSLPPPEGRLPLSGLVGFGFRQALREQACLRREKLARLYSLGSAGLEFLEILSGRANFCVYRKTKPWDHAAGALLIAESGGIGVQLNGDPYRPSQDYNAGLVGVRPSSRLPNVQALLTDIGLAGR